VSASSVETGVVAPDQLVAFGEFELMTHLGIDLQDALRRAGVRRILLVVAKDAMRAQKEQCAAQVETRLTFMEMDGNNVSFEQLADELADAIRNDHVMEKLLLTDE
jgi:hypothetical protein